MPKSKRDKKISLTKTSKKGLTLKQHIIEDVRTCVEKYSTIVLFSVHNMRNNTLKEIRGKWTGSRFFFGKNKIIALALGKSAETEIADGISKLASKLSGQCGLFFTNENQTNVLKWMRDYEQTDYARSGFRTSVTIELPAGPLEDFPHSIEPHLRQLGMPTSLQKGVVTLVKDYTICANGQTLTPEQASILKLLGHSLAKFKLTPLGVFTKTTGYENIAENNETKENEENIMEE
ncbi:PREDICTED: mRNA turnover protein 4 homolog [Ceratosolen solmsi marchali]|uniref:Ribosome assembly factor mrt4 n=1 Tax=Ceratosolen solmsi marchali TaxID=326594 RepID=A0AAJ6YJ78_9HYME|nr:PREDICTED: mRNA turnover protein 4 homolog [Ceratosolen solmsi marchali]